MNKKIVVYWDMTSCSLWRWYSTKSTELRDISFRETTDFIDTTYSGTHTGLFWASWIKSKHLHVIFKFNYPTLFRENKNTRMR